MTNSILNNFIFYNYKKFDSEVDSYNPLTTNLPSAGRRVGVEIVEKMLML